MVKKLLSKSQVNLYLQCPFKWKKCYIDKIKSKPSPAMLRGINIHRKIENFYRDMKPDEDLKHFIKFELRRIKDMIDAGKFDKKYFFPLFQELRLSNQEMGMRGICDAVFINPDDDGLIIIDWKSGKYYPKEFDSYRFELAVYAELVRLSGLTDEVPKYWGIYFCDADKLFFEKIDEKYIKKMYETVKEAREGMESGVYEPKKNKYCYFCDFKSECPLMRWGR